MAKALQTTRSTVTVYNLTDTSIRAESPQVPTLNELGYTLARNAIDFTNEVGSSRVAIDANAGSSSSVGLANIFQVLKIPEGGIVHDIFLTIPKDKTVAPTVNDGGAIGANALLNFSWAAYKSASKATIKGDVLGGFGTLAANASTNAITYFPTISASTPWTRTVKLLEPTVTNATWPAYFPYGGYVEMQFSGGASTNAVSTDVYFSGNLEVVAVCSKMPD